jgi:hypothetical protein
VVGFERILQASVCPPFQTTLWSALRRIFIEWQRRAASRRLQRIAADITAHVSGG